MSCSICGEDPCYGICPNNDPYAGDQRRESEDHDFFAASDYLSEAYGAEIRAIEAEYEAEAAYHQEQWEEQQADPFRAVCVDHGEWDFRRNCQVHTEEDNIPF